MEDRKEEQLDALISKVIRDVGLECPAKDFTTTVLFRLPEHADKNKVYAYRPLISNYVWAFLVISILFVPVFLLWQKPSMEYSWLALLRLNELNAFNPFAGILDIPVATPFVYGFIGLAFFVGIQVILLKRHLNRRYMVQ